METDKGRELWAMCDGVWHGRPPSGTGETVSMDPRASPETTCSTQAPDTGHAPSLFFHEAWYLAKYPTVREAVQAGFYQSGFDHFRREGHAGLMPHWLFHPDHYRRQHARAHGRAFDPAADGDPYDHFLREGQFQGLSGHWLFDPPVHAALAPHDVAARIRHDGPFTAFLLHVRAGGPEPVVSNLFDPVWYLARYVAVAREVAEGRWECALHHYLANETPCRFDPSPRFSERAYLVAYPDISAAAERGDFRNGFEHFLHHGREEGRFYEPPQEGGTEQAMDPFRLTAITAHFPLRTRAFEEVTLLPCRRDPASRTGYSFGVLDRDGKPLEAFGHGWLGMRAREEVAPREPGTFIYGGVLMNHFGHFLADGLANLWFIRQRPDLPVLWHYLDLAGYGILTVAHDPWPDWMDQTWRILGLDRHRHHLVAMPVTADRVILPDSGLLTAGALHVRQAEALAVMPRAEPWHGGRVWLSRRALPDRFTRFEGEAEVEAILTARGWTILHPETLPVTEQAAVFAMEDVVAGCIGSAFHALLLSATVRARLILVTRPGLEHSFFDAVARARDLRQSYVVPDLKPHEPGRVPPLFAFADPGRLANEICAMTDLSALPPGRGAIA